MNKTALQALSTIHKYLKVSNPPEKADVIFICGGSSLLPAKKAAELYKKGYAPKIVTISKWGTFSAPETKDKGEAYYFSQELIHLGVPEKDIYWQSIIQNTLEEAQQSILFIQKHGLNPKKVILVDRPFHQRRAWAQFTFWYPEIKFINQPADEPLVENQESIDRVVAELVRLEKYASQGSLQKQILPSEVVSAWDTLKSQVKKEL